MIKNLKRFLTPGTDRNRGTFFTNRAIMICGTAAVYLKLMIIKVHIFSIFIAFLLLYQIKTIILNIGEFVNYPFFVF